MATDLHALANELEAAKTQASTLSPPSSRGEALSFGEAYRVQAELGARLRRAGGQPTGRKVGLTNKAVWAALGLDRVIWSTVYQHTVHYAENDKATLAVAGMCAPRLEPEIVFGLQSAPPAETDAPEALLASVAWLALGFEIVDCHYPGWSFRPTDAIADYGLHAALIVGSPRPVEADTLSALAAQLGDFSLRLYRGDTLAAEGTGSNVLGHPALALGWLAQTIKDYPEAAPLAAGEVITTGTITAALDIHGGERYKATVEGLELPSLELSVE